QAGHDQEEGHHDVELLFDVPPHLGGRFHLGHLHPGRLEPPFQSPGHLRLEFRVMTSGSFFRNSVLTTMAFSSPGNSHRPAGRAGWGRRLPGGGAIVTVRSPSVPSGRRPPWPAAGPTP